MKADLETAAQMQAIASWRVAVTQGLTLLGFKQWVIECTHYPSAVCSASEGDLVARTGSDD